MTQPTEQRIRLAALQLFSKKGYGATGIRDIAVEAGITSSTLYHYIGTKEDLLLKIMREALTAIIEDAKNLLLASTLPECRLVSLVQLHVFVHMVDQLTTLVVDIEYRALTGENRLMISNLRKEYESIWRSILDQGQKEGVFNFQNIKLTTFALLEMCTGVSRWYSSQGKMAIEDITLVFSDMALNLVDARRYEKKILVKDLDIPNPTAFSSKVPLLLL